MSAVEIKVVNKNDDKTLTIRTLHYPEDGIVSISKDYPILNAVVESALAAAKSALLDFEVDVDSTKVVLTVTW